MVTWRCCGYITANDRARSALHAELLTVCLSVCLSVRGACCSVSLWLGDSSDAVAGWQFDSWLSDRREKSGVTASRGSFFRGIMRNVELWFLLPFDSWQGERGGLSQSTGFISVWVFKLYSQRLKFSFDCAALAPVLNLSGLRVTCHAKYIMQNI